MKKHILILSIAEFSRYAESNSPVNNTKLTTFFAHNLGDVVEPWRSVCKNMESLGYFSSAKTTITILSADGGKEEFTEKSAENQVFENILRDRFSR